MPRLIETYYGFADGEIVYRYDDGSESAPFTSRDVLAMADAQPERAAADAAAMGFPFDEQARARVTTALANRRAR